MNDNDLKMHREGADLLLDNSIKRLKNIYHESPRYDLNYYCNDGTNFAKVFAERIETMQTILAEYESVKKFRSQFYIEDEQPQPPVF